MIGQARQPEMGDQAHMPFTMAVVHEVQRYADIVPLGVPHMTTRDIKVQGFLIPKVGVRGSPARAQHHLRPGSPSTADIPGRGASGSPSPHFPRQWGWGREPRQGWPCPFRAPSLLGKTN